MGRADEQRAEILAAPMKVGGHLGEPDLAEQRAPRGIDPQAAWRGDPDVALGIALHAVRNARLELGADPACEHPAAPQPAAAIELEHPDQRLRGVVDVQQTLIRREAEPVRLIEQRALDQELGLAPGAAARDPIDALEAQLPRPFDAVDRHPPVPWIGEVDGTARVDADVVRAVELAALEVRGEDLAAAVAALADQRGGRVLAHDEVEVGIVGQAVALVRRPPDLAHAAPGIPAPADVARHVGEQEVVLQRVPDRPFGELEAGADLADRRELVDQVAELRPHHRVRHGRFLPDQAGNQLRFG